MNSQQPPLQDEQLSAVTDSATIQLALQKKLESWAIARGELTLPCVPAMLENYMQRIEILFATIGKPWSKEELQRLRQILARRLEEGFRSSPHSKLVIRYESENYPSSPSVRLSVNVSTVISSFEDHYKRWTQHREPPLFGTHPDAKVMTVIRQLGEANAVPILDVGAGTGRNSLPLARLGYPVQALELAPALVGQLQSAVNLQGLPVMVTSGNVLDPKVELSRSHYALAIAAEVVASHFNSVEQLHQLLARMCDVLRPGGLFLFNMFLANHGYQPDLLAKELSEVAWSCLFDRAELAAASAGLPLELISDESVYQYEKEHLPPEAWPPTGWFIKWSQGRDLFPIENPPMELRWLLYKRL